jgi:hypothetical protein
MSRRTYSFEASAELADRVAQASVALATFPSDSPEVDAWIGREFEMGLARLRRVGPGLADDPAAFMRAAVEMVVGAVEKVTAGLGIEDQLRAWAAEDAEGGAFRRGALEASTPVWHDE